MQELVKSTYTEVLKQHNDAQLSNMLWQQVLRRFPPSLRARAEVEGVLPTPTQITKGSYERHEVAIALLIAGAVEILAQRGDVYITASSIAAILNAGKYALSYMVISKRLFPTDTEITLPIFEAIKEEYGITKLESRAPITPAEKERSVQEYIKIRLNENRFLTDGELQKELGYYHASVSDIKMFRGVLFKKGHLPTEASPERLGLRTAIQKMEAKKDKAPHIKEGGAKALVRDFLLNIGDQEPLTTKDAAVILGIPASTFAQYRLDLEDSGLAPKTPRHPRDRFSKENKQKRVQLLELVVQGADIETVRIALGFKTRNNLLQFIQRSMTTGQLPEDTWERLKINTPRQPEKEKNPWKNVSDVPNLQHVINFIQRGIPAADYNRGTVSRNALIGLARRWFGGWDRAYVAESISEGCLEFDNTKKPIRIKKNARALRIAELEKGE